MAYADSNVVPIPEPLSTAEQEKILPDDRKWTDDYALSVVKSDWAYAESYRINAHDWRYRNANELYLAWAGQRYWDGTRVPRSSLGMYVVFEQVEAMLPKVISAVTSTNSYHFQAEMGEEDERIPEAWKELVSNQLDEINFREQIQQCVKSMEIYGNGVIEVGWEEYEDEYIHFEEKRKAAKIVTVQHPTAGMINVPTGIQSEFKRVVTRETKGRPYVRYVSLIDFYVDPACESVIIQNGAGYVIKRVYMSAGKLKSFKGQEGFRIPDDQYITTLTRSKSTAQQDVSKLSTELFRYNMWNPSQDYTSDPAQRKLAVIEYTTPTRKIWWLQGGEQSQSIVYNAINKYGMINYFAVPYANVLDRWHGLSIADVAEGEQRLQTAIINARIDELALAIHKPMVKRRGVTIPQYQLKVRPGVVIETENPEGDIMQLEASNITQQAFIEVEASDRRVQRATGMSDLAALGTPSSGGNSANRTATGVNTQLSATQGRVTYIVENIESMIIEPAVNMIIRLNRKFMDIKTAVNWLKVDKRFQGLDPKKVLNTRVTAECRASTKMAAKSNFLQLLPMLAQVWLNPELLQMMAQQTDKTFDAEEFMHMTLDALNYSPRNPLIVDLTPQQKQAAQQPPAAEALKAQIAQQKMQSDQQIDDKRQRSKMLETILKELLGAHTEHSRMDNEMQRHSMDTHMEAQRHSMDSRLELAKLLAEMHSGQQDRELAMEQAKQQKKQNSSGD